MATPQWRDRVLLSSRDDAGNGSPPTRLARKLGVGDAIAVGLASIAICRGGCARSIRGIASRGRAEIAIGAAVIALVAALDVGGAIGFSSFAVLAYDAVTNASALTLLRDGRRGSRPITALGLVGCITVATGLPARTVESGAILLAAGAARFAIRRRLSSRA